MAGAWPGFGTTMSTHEAPELMGPAASSFGAALVALLVPKCPLCVAAYLASFGLSAAAARGAAAFVRPFALALAGLAFAALALGVWRSLERRKRPGCCSRGSARG